MKKINTYIIIFFTFIAILSCKKAGEIQAASESKETPHSETEITVTKAQFKNAKMVLGAITKQSFSEIVRVTGMVDAPPQSKAVITSFYAGNVHTSDLLIGDKVKKGQALVRIINPDFVDMQQEFLEIAEQLDYLKIENERQKILFDEKITSQKNYLKTKSIYKSKKATYNGLRKKLQMLHINPTAVKQGKITSTITLFSPISGYITKVNVSKGTYVSPQDIVLEIVNTDHVHIELTAFEKDIMAIKKGQHINFKIPEASTEIFDAEVYLVGTSVDKTTRTVKIHGHLHDEKKNKFTIGMFVDAEIETTNKYSFALPKDAIIERDKEFVVLVLENKSNEYVFKPVEVTIGKKHNGFVEILSKNIKPTDKILIKGGFSLIGTEGGGHSH